MKDVEKATQLVDVKPGLNVSFDGGETWTNRIPGAIVEQVDKAFSGKKKTSK